jgi:3-hydroxyisobutyrate dehydrogenase-like beta-hydroxyacid dehydrogenase
MSGSDTPTIAVLGLGEAGGALALGLAGNGVTVRGYDPVVPAPAAILDCRDEADATVGADLVLSVNSADAALPALRRGLTAAGPSTVWADLNTAAPDLKRELAELCARREVRFADLAIMAPVPGRGLRVPILASGTGAAATAELLTAAGGAVTVLDGPAGAAAERKLLRSVFFKGMSAAILEALDAACAVGLADWLRGEIDAELRRYDPTMVQRMIEGSRRHAVRRAKEMDAAAAMLRALGVAPRIAMASRDQLQELAEASGDQPGEPTEEPELTSRSGATPRPPAGEAPA